MAWISFIELDKAVVHVIRLASCLWLWFQSVCSLMPFLSAYHLIWVSLSLDVGYLFMAVSTKWSCCSWPCMWGTSSQPLLGLVSGNVNLQKLWKIVWRFLKKFKIELPYNSAILILLLVIYPEEIRTLIKNDICTSVLTAGLFTKAKIWESMYNEILFSQKMNLLLFHWLNLKHLTMCITTNCGKFLKRGEYPNTLPASWEICMQVKKQQLEPGMEQYLHLCEMIEVQ